MSKFIRIALIHAVEVAMAPIAQAFSEHWPEAELVNIWDDSLSIDRARDGVLTNAMSSRIVALGDYAISLNADAILYTCSAFGPAIEEFAQRSPVPTLKPNEAMFDAAFKAGQSIGMLATFPPSVESMEDEFREAAGRRDIDLETVLVADALDALKSGDAPTHNNLLADVAPQLAHCDAIMLAHFSTSRARAAVSEVVDVPVLTSPDAAAVALRNRLT